jgi:hypothetical protein
MRIINVNANENMNVYIKHTYFLSGSFTHGCRLIIQKLRKRSVRFGGREGERVRGSEGARE